MSAVITLLEQSTCQAGRKSNQTTCRKVGTFRNQTAGYADCDNETAGYVNGNVAEVTAGKEIKGADTFPLYIAKYQKV